VKVSWSSELRVGEVLYGTLEVPPGRWELEALCTVSGKLHPQPTARVFGRATVEVGGSGQAPLALAVAWGPHSWAGRRLTVGWSLRGRSDRGHALTQPLELRPAAAPAAHVAAARGALDAHLEEERAALARDRSLRGTIAVAGGLLAGAVLGAAVGGWPGLAVAAVAAPAAWALGRRLLADGHPDVPEGEPLVALGGEELTLRLDPVDAASRVAWRVRTWERTWFTTFSAPGGTRTITHMNREELCLVQAQGELALTAGEVGFIRWTAPTEGPPQLFQGPHMARWELVVERTGPDGAEVSKTAPVAVVVGG
jgi:hypothetical protein